MAYCPQCDTYVSPLYLMTRPMVCPECKVKLGFVRKEYRRVVSPGLFIFLVLIFNVRYTTDPQLRALFNIIILVVWGFFFFRYIQYLKQTRLEERDQSGRL